MSYITKHHTELALVWMGTPCATWSRARKWDGGPPPLRGDEALEGLHNLHPHDQLKVIEENQLRDVSHEVALPCNSLDVPWAMESHFSSRTFQQLLSMGARFARVDFCAFGTPWRKSAVFFFLPALAYGANSPPLQDSSWQV